MASFVTLKFGNRTEETNLIEGRVHIPTVKDTFALCVVNINCELIPFNHKGFTHVKFNPGDILIISGTPAEVSATPGASYLYGFESAHGS